MPHNSISLSALCLLADKLHLSIDQSWEMPFSGNSDRYYKWLKENDMKLEPRSGYYLWIPGRQRIKFIAFFDDKEAIFEFLLEKIGNLVWRLERRDEDC